MNEAKSEAKFDKKYQGIFNKFKDHHKTANYELDWIDEVYLPFWLCKQEIVVQSQVEADKFSKILLDLIDNNVKSHKKICDFLGIEEDDFTLTQLHFLISNDLIEENTDKGLYYEITHEGRNFMEGNKNSLINIDTIKYEYVINDLEYLQEEKYQTFYNNYKKDFFDESDRINNNQGKEFSRYNFKNYDFKESVNKIQHSKDKPTLNKINNSNFIEYFNLNYNKGVFYDFSNKQIEAHKRSILFYFLYYVNRDDGDNKIEIRHCKSTVNKFYKEHLEERLSKQTKKYINNNPEFLEELKDRKKNIE